MADDAARAALRDDLARWSVDLVERVEARDWDAVRAATEAVRQAPAALVPALAEAIEGAADPRAALALGLAVEEPLAEGDLDAAAAALLGRALVPRLADALAGGRLGDDERLFALRLLSRFPGEPAAEERLLALLADPGLPPEARRAVLYALAEAGGGRAVPPIEHAFGAAAAQGDAETARVAVHALARLAMRSGDADLGARVERSFAPRLHGQLALAAEDPDLFARLTGTLAAVAGLRPEVYLAGAIVPDRALAAPIRALALEALGPAAPDPEALALLEGARGRVGEPDLEDLLAAVIARWRAALGE